jgi:phage-related tail protein
LESVQKDLAALQEDKQRLSDELAKLKAQAVEQQQAAAGQARLQQSNLQVSQDNLLAKSKQLVQCENNNAGMYQINTDLLARYEQAYKSAYLLKGGLFTQLGIVKLENDNAQEREKLQSLRVKNPAP